MDEEGHPVVVDEEEVEFVAERRVLLIKIDKTMVEESVGGLKVVHHEFFIFAHVCLSVDFLADFVLGAPHLHHIDHLPYIVTGALDQSIGSLIIYELEFFCPSRAKHEFFYVDRLRFLELYDITMGLQRTEFLIVEVVADADDRSLRLLNYVNHGSYATPIPRTQPITLVHNNHAFLRGDAADSRRQGVRILIGSFQPCGAEIV